jgi:hypothetical protein
MPCWQSGQKPEALHDADHVATLPEYRGNGADGWKP